MSTNATFFSVAFADNARAHLTQAHIRSLREFGRFDGPIVIATDRPGCLAATLGPVVLGEGAQPVTRDIVSVYPSPRRSSASRTIHIMDLRDTEYDHGTEAWPKMGYELVKAAARNLCSKAYLPFKPDIVMVIDADIVVMQPVAPFLQSLSHLDTPLAVFYNAVKIDENTVKQLGHSADVFHTGLVVSRPGSKNCLDQWDAEIRSTKVDPVAESTSTSLLQVKGNGQKALSRTQCANDGLVKVMPSSLMPSSLTPSRLRQSSESSNGHQEDFLNGQREAFFGWPTNQTVSTDKTYMFMHMTTHRLTDFLQDVPVQSYIERNLKHDYKISGAESCLS